MKIGMNTNRLVMIYYSTGFLLFLISLFCLAISSDWAGFWFVLGLICAIIGKAIEG